MKQRDENKSFHLECAAVGADKTTLIQRTTPILDPRLAEIARWSCGDMGAQWASGREVVQNVSPAMLQVLRCIGALDEAIGKRGYLPQAVPGSPVRAFKTEMGDFGAEIGLKLGGVQSVLHIERIGDQYVFTDTSLGMHSLVLDIGEAFALGEAICDLALAVTREREKHGELRIADELMSVPAKPTPEQQVEIEKSAGLAVVLEKSRVELAAADEHSRTRDAAAKAGFIPSEEEKEMNFQRRR